MLVQLKPEQGVVDDSVDDLLSILFGYVEKFIPHTGGIDSGTARDSSNAFPAVVGLVPYQVVNLLTVVSSYFAHGF
jgi:hypothetical protein